MKKKRQMWRCGLSLSLAVIVLATAGVLSAQSEVPERVSVLRETAIKYQAENKLEEAEKIYREIIEDFAQTSYAVESQSEIICIKIRSGDKVAAVTEYQKFLSESIADESRANEIYKIAQEFKNSGDKDLAVVLHKANVANSPVSVGSLLSQGEIVQNAFDKKDYSAVDAGLTVLKEKFVSTPGVAKELFNVAQRYQKEGKRDEAIALYRYNLDAYSDTFDGTVSQLEIVYDAFNRKDYDAVDKEAGFLLDNFSSRPGMDYGIYMIGRKYQDAGFVDKAEQVYRKCVADASGLGAMLAQKVIIYNRLAKKNYGEVDAEVSLFKDIFVETDGVTKHLYEIAQKLQQNGRNEDAVRLHRYNVEKYYDKYDSMVSQLDIIYDAFDRRDFSTADKETEFLLANFSKNAGMDYGMYAVGKRYKDAGFAEMALKVYEICVADSGGFGAMLSLTEIMKDSLDRKDVTGAAARGAELFERFKNEWGLPGQLLDLGKRFSVAGDHDTAIKYFSINLEKYPDKLESVQSGVEKVKTCIAANSFDKADAAVDEYIKIYSGKTTLCRDLVAFEELFSKAGVENKKQQMLEKLNVAVTDTAKSEDVRKRIISLSDMASIASYQDNLQKQHEIADTLIADYVSKFKDVVYDGKHSPWYVFQIADMDYERAENLRIKGQSDTANPIYNNAIVTLDKFLQISDLSKDYKYKSYFLKGICYGRIGMLEEAEYCYKMQMQMDADKAYTGEKHGESYYYLRDIYRRMERKGMITEAEYKERSINCFVDMEKYYQNDHVRLREAKTKKIMLLADNNRFVEAGRGLDDYKKVFGDNNEYKALEKAVENIRTAKRANQ